MPVVSTEANFPYLQVSGEPVACERQTLSTPL